MSWKPEGFQEIFIITFTITNKGNTVRIIKYALEDALELFKKHQEIQGLGLMFIITFLALGFEIG